jgi:hypothetical protein
MGGTGYASTDPRLVNALNPASWTWLARARLESEIHFDIVQTNTATQEGRNQNLRFGGFVFGAPVWNAHSMSIGLGVQPITDANGQIDFGDSVSTRSYRSEGGVSMLFGGVSGMITSGVSLGGRFELLFGNIRHLTDLQFSDINTASGSFERDYSINGSRGTFGLLIAGDSIAPAFHGIHLAFGFSLATKLNTTQRTVVTPFNTDLDTTIETVGVGSYPASIQAGIGISLSDRYRAYGDVHLQDFSAAYLYSTSSSPVADSSLRSTNRFAFGIEKVPNMVGEYGISSFWDRLGLRLGASYYVTPFRPAGSGGINEVAISAGVGIPISYESLLDLAITVGQRTPTTLNAAPTDKFIRLSGSISLSERWFVPSRVSE